MTTESPCFDLGPKTFHLYQNNFFNQSSFLAHHDTSYMKVIPSSSSLLSFLLFIQSCVIFPAVTNGNNPVVIFPPVILAILSFSVIIAGCYYGRKRKSRGQHLSTGKRVRKKDMLTAFLNEQIMCSITNACFLIIWIMIQSSDWYSLLRFSPWKQF